MGNKLIVGICLIGLILGGGFTLAIGQELAVPTGYITLEAPGDVQARRAPVDFPHGLHFDYNCKTCHHKWDNSDQIQSCTTSGCHDLEQPPKNPKAENAYAFFKTAFHDRCLGCHREIKAKNKALAGTFSSAKIAKAGPTGCVECHPKE